MANFTTDLFVMLNKSFILARKMLESIKMSSVWLMIYVKSSKYLGIVSILGCGERERESKGSLREGSSPLYDSEKYPCLA